MEKMEEAEAAKSASVPVSTRTAVTKIDATNAEREHERLQAMGLEPSTKQSGRAAKSVAALIDQKQEGEFSEMDAEVAAAMALRKMMIRAENGL